MNESGNTIEFARLPSGVIVYEAYDQWNNVVVGAPILADFDRYVQENSYGRNRLQASINAACPTLTNPGFEAPNIFRYSIDCPNQVINWRWVYRTIRHESGHGFGMGEGESWDANGQAAIPGLNPNYGDLYDPQGHENSLTGHWAAPHKEVAGFIGAFGLRPLTLITGSGIYEISNIESQSEGPKCLKILRRRWVIAQGDGTIIQDIRTFCYLELRSRHQYRTLTGKGKKKRTTLTHAPAVQVRDCEPVYNIERWRVRQRLRIDIGNDGGLGVGAGFSGEEVHERTVFDTTSVLSRRPFSLRVQSINESSAVVAVTYG